MNASKPQSVSSSPDFWDDPKDKIGTSSEGMWPYALALCVPFLVFLVGLVWVFW